MESISQVFAWIGAHETVLSGLAAAIVIVGVLLSPLRQRLSRSAANKSDPPAETPQPAAPVVPITDRPSIAVLPFSNLSGDAEQQYLADGLAEDIITGLSRVKQFFVIARNSSFTYKGQAVDVQQVSRDLGVRYVLEGSIRATGNRIRVTAQLIDATTRAHTWAERYDRPLADILEVDDEVTDAIVAALQPALRRAEVERSRRADTGDLGAWALVNRAWVSIQSDLGDPEKWRTAAQACEEAIKLDPDYALAYAVLAHARSLASQEMGFQPENPTLMEPIQRALELAPDDPAVQHAYAAVLGNLGRAGDAIRAWERSLELNPNNAGARAGLGIAQIYQNQLANAVANIDTARRLSPNDPLLYHWLAHRALACAMLTRWEEALENGADSVHRNGSRVGWAAYAAALAYHGRNDEAARAWRALADRTPGLSVAPLATFVHGIEVDKASGDAVVEALERACEAAASSAP